MTINKERIKDFLNQRIKVKTKEGTIHKKNITKDDQIMEDLLQNHNHSWYQELWNRNKNNLDDYALIYRGNKITYREMFENMKKYAKSLKEMGLGVDSEIPVCISNCPEIVYLMGAASLIGAKLNIFGSHFPKDYVTEIINNSKSNVVFMEDNAYAKLESSVTKSNAQNIVLTSLRDSLTDNFNPYEELDKKHGLFKNRVNEFKLTNPKILSQFDFKQLGNEYNGEINAHTDMNQDFLITYTSGSTNEERPKALVHSSKNFIILARYHDKDINGITTKSFTSLAHIPTFSNTNLVSCISDSLMQGAKLALEPTYDKDFFVDSMIMHNPHYVAAPKSFWINAAKKLLYSEEYKKSKLLNLLMAFVCGEPYELNEERLINRALKKAKAGTAITRTPFSIVRSCEAAGDCEHGSIFYTLFRSYQNKTPKNKIKKEEAGLVHFPFVEVAVLDPKGKRLGPNKLGRIVANSPCTMKRYHNNEKATKNFFIQDEEGKIWADMSVYGYKDKQNKYHIRERIPEKEEKIPPFIIAKKILEDRKNILSCEVIFDKETNNYIAHIELQPDAPRSIEEVIEDADIRCSYLMEMLGANIYYRIHSFEESFQLTKSGKRNGKALLAEGMTNKCVRPVLKNYETVLKSQNEIEEAKRKIK